MYDTPTAPTLELTGTFVGKEWTRAPVDEWARGPEGTSLLGRAHIINVYDGDVEAEGAFEYLFAFPTAESGIDAATFVGLGRIVGRFGDRDGSLVVRHEGTSSPSDGIRGTMTVVPGSSTGALGALGGTGEFSAGPGDHHRCTFRLTLAPA